MSHYTLLKTPRLTQVSIAKLVFTVTVKLRKANLGTKLYKYR